MSPSLKFTKQDQIRTMIVLNSVFPVFALIFLGKGLRHFGFTNDTFLKTSDKLVYFIFFPAMLFWKIGSGGTTTGIDWGLCAASFSALFVVFVLSTGYIFLGGVSNFEAGSFSQSCYRFNTYIGMAVIMNALGEDGIRQFGILIGLIIPVINVLCVSVLIWFSGQNYNISARWRLTLRALLSNPLIIACLAGILFSKLQLQFPLFVENTLRLISLVTLPMALLSIGGAFTLEKLRGHLRLSMVASSFKLFLLPLAGYLFLKHFGASEIGFKVGMIFLALPTSTSIYVLSAQLNSDTDLASASIVLSTLLSFVSLSGALLLVS